ncbi:MAG: PAS domain S-box protein, partial [Raineya sp.]|nr:PAS domain S-box protein [Raineya sp.]
MSNLDIESQLPYYLVNSEIFAVIVTDLAGNYVYYNETFRKNFIFSEDLLEKSCLSTIAPEDYELCKKTVEKCFKHPDKTFSIYLHKRTANKSDFYLTHWEFSAFRGTTQEISGILGIGYDVSYLLESQKLIKDNEIKLRALLESSEYSQVLISPEFKILLYNQKVNEIAKELLGKRIAVGDSILSYVTPNDKEHFLRCFYKALQGETTEVEQQKEARGKKFWVLEKYAPVYDAEGKILGVSLIMLDIDEKKRMQDKLKSSEIKLRAIVDSTNDNNVLISSDFKVLSFNKKAFENVKFFFGAEMKEGDDFRKYVVPTRETDFQNYVRRALQGETIIEELCIDLENGEQFWFLVSFYPAYDEEGNLIGVSYNASDIDKRKKYELLLEEQNRQLREIAYIQSHKVRKPVANILGLM